MNENTIMDLPTGIVTFYMDTNEPRMPGRPVIIDEHISLFENIMWNK